jgi:hypothetical protein
MSESREVVVAGAATDRGILTIADTPPWGLSLQLGERRYHATGVDLFESLSALRGQLEVDGLQLCVAGARADVFPSGMSRQMGGGRRAYRLVAGRTPELDDLVDVFDPADQRDVVGVDEQLASVQRLREGG